MTTNTALRHTARAEQSRHQAIANNLQSDLDAARDLAGLLNRENQLLRSSTDAINAELSSVVEDKQVHIEVLEANAIAREAWIRPLIKSEKLSAKGMEKQAQLAWLSLLEDNPEFLSTWDRIEKYVQICQRLNQINGRLIGFRKQRGQRLAEILFGKPQANTYSAKGQSEAARASTSFVTA